MQQGPESRNVEWGALRLHQQLAPTRVTRALQEHSYGVNGAWAWTLCLLLLLLLPVLLSSSIIQHSLQFNGLERITPYNPNLLPIMANNNKYYYSLPTPAPQQHRSGSRRPPLTPSTVSSPCLTTHAPVVTRRDSGSGSPTKASILLAKVACNPSTPKGGTPTASPLPSPTTRHAEMHSSPLYSQERPSVWRSESARYVRQYRQQGMHFPKHISDPKLHNTDIDPDGYISFPDFEKFCEAQNPYETQHREHTAVKT